MRIKDNTVVSIRYVMKNIAGEVLEENMNGTPVQYLHGSGKILPSLESSLRDLAPGDKKSISIQTDSEITFDVIIDDVREASENEMLNGEPVKETVSSCGPGCNC